MEKINIAELLKECPKGMELYSPLCGTCVFDGLNMGTIICKKQNTQEITFTSRGYYMLPVFDDCECMIFPSKDQRDWSKFQKPFRDGDIIQEEDYKEAPIYLNEKANKQAEEIVEILEPVKEIMEGVYAYDEINCYHQDFADKVRIRLGNDFEIKVEDKITYIVKKQPQYPKTYGECCKVLDIQSDWHLTFELNNPASCDLCVKNEFEYVCKLEAFRKLLICRDAYWKIAMGLGKPWEPDWRKADERKYCIVNTEGSVTKWIQKTTNKILAFPTAEMRDAFYENFKELIGLCKELL